MTIAQKYVIKSKVVEKDHPYLKVGQELFYLYNTFNGQRSMGCYTNLETARYWCDKRNQ